MNDVVNRWLFDPTIGRILFVLAGIAVIMAIVRALSKSAGHYIKDNDAQYRHRRASNDTNGGGKLGGRRPLQRTNSARLKQLGIQGAGFQLLR